MNLNYITISSSIPWLSQTFFQAHTSLNHQFLVHNRKAGVGGQVSCDSHAANGWKNPSQEQSSITVLFNSLNVNMYFKLFSERLALVEEYQTFGCNKSDGNT